MSNQAGETFVYLDPNEEQAYQEVLDFIRTTAHKHPELAMAFFLNGLVFTGPEETADQIENWAGTVCEFESRDRPAFCHGNGPRPDRIVRAKSMMEIVSLNVN